MNLLDMIFIKDYPYNSSQIANNLYYSFGKDSSIGINKKLFEKNKIYESYEIINEYSKNLEEGFKEYKAIIKTSNIQLFVRIIIDDSDCISDIMIHRLNNEEEYLKYKRIFFSEKEKIYDDYLLNTPACVLELKDNNLLIVKNAMLILKHLGYEDWDFNNKHNNFLNNVMVDYQKLLGYINNKSNFSKEIAFIANGGKTIKINIEFKYYKYLNDYYLLSIK